MAEENADKVGAVRGPSYPFIDLAKALERVEIITSKGAERTTLAPESFYKFWNYQPKSSNARQTMAAMNAYGLVEYVGRGKDRKVKLSESARRIALDRTPNSQSRALAIRQAALEPTAFHDLWEQFGPHLPHVDVMTSWLVLEKEFNQSGADAAVANFLSTVEYAGLEKPDNKPENSDSQIERAGIETEPARVGDMVECEVNGQLVFDAPVRVREVTDDGEWVFVDGSETGIAMENISVVERAKADSRQPPRLPLAQVEPPPPPKGNKRWSTDLIHGPLDLAFEGGAVVIQGRSKSIEEIGEFIDALEQLKKILEASASKPNRFLSSMQEADD